MTFRLIPPCKLQRRQVFIAKHEKNLEKYALTSTDPQPHPLLPKTVEIASKFAATNTDTFEATKF
jgi:hypothetical protein